MAEEVGVEPTKHFYSTSTALKAARTTRCDALPAGIISKFVLDSCSLVAIC